ncbi:hypothetical protein E2C01_067084 [Portunus trituberculatus]|uniref:Uncharacterized protein n=1 Tax=Portunus trituberculatus TaxID=210409 RepID=A0A5B7HIW1_PORTR|nr:hypothetical protein [Portunus trituberculatus]
MVKCGSPQPETNASSPVLFVKERTALFPHLFGLTSSRSSMNDVVAPGGLGLPFTHSPSSSAQHKAMHYAS